MGRNRKEQTYIKSIRVNQDIKEFLESLENANIFVLQQIEETEDYKKFVAYKKSQDQTGNLFELPN